MASAVMVVVMILALFAFSLAAAAAISLAVTFVICAGCAAVVSRASMARIGVTLIVIFSFTASWDDVSLGGVKPRLPLLVLGLVMLLVGYGIRNPPHIPWWIHIFAAAATAVTIIQFFFPISEQYLNTRYLTSEAGQALLRRPAAFPTLLSVLFNAYAVPIGIVLACMYVPKALRWIIVAYVSGVAVSCLAAYLGFEGNDLLLRPFVSVVPPAGTRALGFASHPLHLATSAVFATGLACWMAAQSGWATKWVGRISVVILALGLYASGSRGGSAAGILLIALCAFLLPTIRRRIHVVVAAVAVLLAGIIGFTPALGTAILKTTRLYGGTTNEVSDVGRGQVLQQGLGDFRESPIYGIGVRYISEAHTLYAGVLASGGLIFFAAYLAFTIGSLRAVASTLLVDRALGGALLATLIASLAYWAVADEFSIASVEAVYGFVLALTLLVPAKAATSRVELRRLRRRHRPSATGWAAVGSASIRQSSTNS